MNARDQILQTLRANTRATTLPFAWRSDRYFNDPAGRFTEALTKVKGYVHRAQTMGDALAQLEKLLAELNARSIVYNDEPPLTEIAWAERFPNLQFRNPQQVPDRQAWRALCASADVGITSADAALVETGSLVVSSGPGKSRMVSLLPPVHIAIVPMEKLTTDIFTWKETHSRQFPANTVLVSGPSKTADIEQTMSVGVHGPKKLIVVLVGD